MDLPWSLPWSREGLRNFSVCGQMFKHPQIVCMTYWKHMRFSFNLSALFAVGSMKAFVHGVVPDLFVTSSTDTASKAQRIMSSAGCK